MNNGWIKIHRKMWDKGYYKNSEYIHLWIHLLLKVNHKPNELLVGNTLITIKRGQTLTSRTVLSLETGIQESKIERILKVFETEQQIEQQTTKKYRIITVLNYHNYQLSEQENEQQLNNNRTTTEQQLNTNKNDKKVKNENNDKKKEADVSEICPDNLKTEIFITAWEDWVEYRKQLKLKPLTEKTIKSQLKFLSSEPDAVAIINQSIQNQWQGLFTLKQNIKQQPQKYGQSDPETRNYKYKVFGDAKQ